MVRKAVGALSIVVLLAGPASGVTIDFSPSSRIASVGEIISVDIVVGDLGMGTAPSLAAFDFTVVFDSVIVSTVDVEFGAFLGDPDDMTETIIASAITPGQTEAVEVSLLPSMVLDMIQPGSFPIVTLLLQAEAPGATELELLDVVLGSASGVPLPVVSGIAQVTVTPHVIAEPGSVILLIVGLIGIGVNGSRPNSPAPSQDG